MTERILEQETLAFQGSGGISAENRSHGFHPAFLDLQTGVVYASCYVDGRPAPFHLLDGLPDEVVVARNPGGRVAAVKASVTSGFIRDGRFYTREEAAGQAARLQVDNVRVMPVDNYRTARQGRREFMAEETGPEMVIEAVDGKARRKPPTVPDPT